MPPHERAPTSRILSALSQGDIVVEGRIPWSSNYTFLVAVRHDDVDLKAVYKPEQGEQPLVDFPPGLFRREIAAYELSTSLGWPNVPETVERTDGPFGAGSLQRFVAADFEQNYFTLFEQSDQHHELLAAMAVFDVISNNTDRKAGHCLIDEDGTIWAIDHGLCFSADPKLRTVIWEFETMKVPSSLLEDISRVQQDLPGRLNDLLNAKELDALRARMAALLENPVFPPLVSQRQYPWPLI